MRGAKKKDRPARNETMEGLTAVVATAGEVELGASQALNEMLQYVKQCKERLAALRASWDEAVQAGDETTAAERERLIEHARFELEDAHRLAGLSEWALERASAGSARALGQMDAYVGGLGSVVTIRQAEGLTRATWVLACSTVGLVLATVVLVAATIRAA